MFDKLKSIFQNPARGAQMEVVQFPFAPSIQYNHPLSNTSTYVMGDSYMDTTLNPRLGSYVNNYRPTAISQFPKAIGVEQNDPRSASY